MPTRVDPKEALSSPADHAARPAATADRPRRRAERGAHARPGVDDRPMVQRLLRPIIRSLPCAQFPSALPRRHRPVRPGGIGGRSLRGHVPVDAEQPLHCGGVRRGETRLLEPDGAARRDGLCTVAARSRSCLTTIAAPLIHQAAGVPSIVAGRSVDARGDAGLLEAGSASARRRFDRSPAPGGPRPTPASAGAGAFAGSPAQLTPLFGVTGLSARPSSPAAGHEHGCDQIWSRVAPRVSPRSRYGMFVIGMTDSSSGACPL